MANKKADPKKCAPPKGALTVRQFKAMIKSGLKAYAVSYPSGELIFDKPIDFNLSMLFRMNGDKFWTNWFGIGHRGYFFTNYFHALAYSLKLRNKQRVSQKEL